MNRPAELLIQYVNRESGNIPPDLAALINAALIPTFTQHHRRKLRDERICQAAALLGGSLEAKADRLAEVVRPGSTSRWAIGGGLRWQIGYGRSEAAD